MGTRITFAQHIYANLTTEQSPAGRRGYQTLSYTRDRLSASAVRAIENRSQHRSTQGIKSKWQFFGLPGEQVVISYLTGVPEPDEFGRKGQHMAHSIIIEPRDWGLIGSTPFGLMMPTSFCQTMDQALTLGNLKTGELNAASLDITQYGPARAIALAQQWTAEELCKLARLACHPQVILQRGHFVSIVGNEQQILAALELALLLAPAPRLTCAFDTSSAGCSWPRELNFWGQGFAEQREARSPFVVLAEQRKVRLPDGWSPPQTQYEYFLTTQLNSGQIASIPSQQQAVHIISSALTGQSVTPGMLAGVSDVVKNDFASANQLALTKRIADLLPNDLPEYFEDKILSKIGRTPKERLEWLLRNPAGEELGEILFWILADWSDDPGREIKRSITPIIVRHAGLRLLFGLWGQDRREIYSSLSIMEADEYRRYLQKLSLRTYAKAQDFFCAKHLNLWFQILYGQFDVPKLVEGISFVALYGTQSDCDQLKGVVENLTESEDRNDLLKSLNEKPFRKQVKTLISALKESLRPKSDSAAGGSSWLKRITRS